MALTDKNKHFKLVNASRGVRSGVLTTRRGTIPTPTFMPDGTRGTVKGLSAAQVKTTGIDIILANTYHLHMQPGETAIAALGGIHGFGRWQGPILTDSGGFQGFSLAKARKITEDGLEFRDPLTGDKVFLSPEISMRIQFKLGSDIFVAFDDLAALDEQGRDRTKEAFTRTHRWLERSVTEFQKLCAGLKEDERPLLFGVVQGGLDKNLRKLSLEKVQTLPVDGIAVGGLSVGETRKEMYEILEYLAPLYDSKRPHFLLGVGDPTDLKFAVEHGVDMLDCVLPTRNARHGTAWVTGDRKIHLTNAKYLDDPLPIDESCDCATCQAGYSRGFLRHQFKVGDPLAGSLTSIHNLRYLQKICEGYREK